MNNSNETNVLNEDILTVTEDFSETIETGCENEISILAYGAVAFQEGIDVIAAKNANAKAFKDILDEILPVGGTIKVPEGRFLLGDTILVENAEYIKIVNNGVIEVDPVPLPKTEDNNTGTSTPETGDNGTENTDSETDNTETENQNQNTDNNGDDDTPAPKAVFEFINCAEVYYEGGTIKSDHTNARINYAPKGHSRVKDVYTSMRTAISATGCGKVEIKNAQFSGLECAILLITPQDPENPENPENDLRNGDVTISNIKVTDTGQPIFVADTNNVTIENADMTSRENMGSGDHFVYCSRNVGNVYIKDCKLDYKDHNYGCAINLRNSEENADLNNSVKFCIIENVDVTGMYRSFVSAKAGTKIVCNKCDITTTTTSETLPKDDKGKYILQSFALLGENAAVHLNNCTFNDIFGMYILSNFADNVKVIVTEGKYLNLNSIVGLGVANRKTDDEILLIMKKATVDTNGYHIFVDDGVPCDFDARFIDCTLSTKNGYFYQSRTEHCTIHCNNCEFEYISDNSDNGANDNTQNNKSSIYLVYYSEDTDSNPSTAPVLVPLLNNMRFINCNCKNIIDVCRPDFYGDAVMYGNEFSDT